MGFEEIWNEYTSSEKDMFQKSVRRLLKQTFIVRDRDEDSKKAYYFVSKRSEPFSAYLGYIGYDQPCDTQKDGECGFMLPLDSLCGPGAFWKSFEKY